MRTTKDFIEQEHSNLAAVLDETLRFKYGLEGSKDFFEECRDRLDFVSAELKRTLDTDTVNLQRIAARTFRLGFADRAFIGKRIFLAICRRAKTYCRGDLH